MRGASCPPAASVQVLPGSGQSQAQLPGWQQEEMHLLGCPVFPTPMWALDFSGLAGLSRAAFGSCSSGAAQGKGQGWAPGTRFALPDPQAQAAPSHRLPMPLFDQHLAEKHKAVGTHWPSRRGTVSLSITPARLFPQLSGELFFSQGI